MADVTLKYKGATIGELSESGSKTLETAGKYCEADILLEYVKSAASGGLTLISEDRITVSGSSKDVSSYTIIDFSSDYAVSSDTYILFVFLISNNTSSSTASAVFAVSYKRTSKMTIGIRADNKFSFEGTNTTFRLGDGTVIHRYIYSLT